MAEPAYDVETTDWGTYDPWSWSGAQYDPDYGAAFGGASGDIFFKDNQTGNIVSYADILRDPSLNQAFEAQYPGQGTPDITQQGSLTNEQLQRQLLQLQIARMTPQQQSALTPWLAGGAVALPSLLGLAGLIQGMTGGGTTTTQTTQPGQSPLAGQAGQAALQGFQ